MAAAPRYPACVDEETYSPGLTYYLMALPALYTVGMSGAILAGARSVDSFWMPRVLIAGLIGTVALPLLVLSWHRFTVGVDGLHVRDLRGSRFHAWPTLGKPRAKAFDRDDAFTSYTHHICTAAGRTLYRLGPWYPRRRHLLMSIRARLRALDEAPRR